MCSVLSNHQAPSRDIAVKMSDLDRVKHLLSGGYWTEGLSWLSPGPKVIALLFENPIIQQHLGWAPEPSWVPSIIKYPPKSKKVARQPLKTSETAISDTSFIEDTDFVTSVTTWLLAPHVTSATRDECCVGSWCVFSINSDGHNTVSD
jgi:hypothetical protein